MACRLCERPVRIPEGPGRLYLSVPVPELGTKLLDLVRGWPERLEPRDGAFEAPTPDFPTFVERLKAASWSAIERCSISLLFLPEGQTLTFASSQESRTLEQWFNLEDARFLTRILDNQALVTHFHPIWDLRNGTHYGWECLTRGVDGGALVRPDLLFSVARRSGMTFPLDRLARQTALRQASATQLPGRLFINFIPTAIYDPVFCLRTTVALALELGLDPARIVFEVVESEKVEDEAHLKRIVDYYRAQGYQVALDDVGSGYSSLNLLASLRPEVIKVDAAIVRDLDIDSSHQAVFRALASMARETGALLLAEGIETTGERDWALANGADLGQGFLWGRPEASPDPHPRYS